MNGNANTLAYHSTATVTAVKYLLVQALGQMYASFYGRNVLIFVVNEGLVPGKPF
jgi:hypothetical protein